jgi:hypothetical protein
MKNVQLDMIASVTKALPLPAAVELSDKIDAREGTVVIVEALEEKNVYDAVEVVSGEMVKIKPGDIIAGALGERKALKGYVGTVPASVKPGDVLHLLNLGGTIGVCTHPHREYGDPIRVKVLGAVKLPFSLNGHSPNIRDFATPWRDDLPDSAPIVLISGTCMNAGKTSAGATVVKHLTERGYRVAAAKLTGVALMRDMRKMQQAGAVQTISFADAGLPSTTNPSSVVPAAKGILHALNQTAKPDVIVVELGAGILGGYSVDRLLRDQELMDLVKVHLMCANDLVAAWGADQLLSNQYGLHIDVMSGPATDNEIGVEYIEENFGIPAVNARYGSRLGQLVEEKLYEWLQPPLSVEVDMLAVNC